MLDFQTNCVNSSIQTSIKDAIKTKNDSLLRLGVLEEKIRLLKSMINQDIYYKSIIEEIVIIQTELNGITYMLFEENVNKCIAERILKENLEALDKILITVGRLIKM